MLFMDLFVIAFTHLQLIAAEAPRSTTSYEEAVERREAKFSCLNISQLSITIIIMIRLKHRLNLRVWATVASILNINKDYQSMQN